MSDVREADRPGAGVMSADERLIIERLDLTCGACPTQYEGVTNDGNTVYIRYRWGELTVQVGRDLDDALDRDPVFQWQHPTNDMDGVMLGWELQNRLPDWIVLPGAFDGNES